VARHLENGTYLLDEIEREAYARAARTLQRIDHRQLDLGQPLDGFDYLLVMCAHLIATGEAGVSESLGEILDDFIDERHRQTQVQ
jgi:hypothetical protein